MNKKQTSPITDEAISLVWILIKLGMAMQLLLYPATIIGALLIYKFRNK